MRTVPQARRYFYSSSTSSTGELDFSSSNLKRAIGSLQKVQWWNTKVEILPWKQGFV